SRLQDDRTTAVMILRMEQKLCSETIDHKTYFRFIISGEKNQFAKEPMTSIMFSTKITEVVLSLRILGNSLPILRKPIAHGIGIGMRLYTGMTVVIYCSSHGVEMLIFVHTRSKSMEWHVGVINTFSTFYMFLVIALLFLCDISFSATKRNLDDFNMNLSLVKLFLRLNFFLLPMSLSVIDTGLPQGQRWRKLTWLKIHDNRSNIVLEVFEVSSLHLDAILPTIHEMHICILFVT
ncbi:hypothetical protein L9F63_012527, partial [Diploptera punctata]